MKVGLVCPYSFHRPGGVQNHVLGLAGWLKSVGHQIAILAPGFPPDGMLADYGLSDAEFTTGYCPACYEATMAELATDSPDVVAWVLPGA